ncbi:T9SS type B sorting domain-containing protein [Cyclobacterium plantarum]|uniref:T9SS type B sorting domain-containing protein n=1 Tax=Cyclobacterium plantarum TaxID=2716263 RepID=A0ABX0H355_9BACT|nr:T9SS type B sorting domain-containing protein [Cyclobacterium plantarum]NHE55870.1 T9SS type B sorting domain-containing protein [Cyclobacterium plantarum]
MSRKFLNGFIFLFFTLSGSLFSQVRIEFSERSSTGSPLRTIFSINGDFAMLGNTNMTLLNYGEDLMNDGMMVFVDVDSDPNTFNSSSATLNFPEENGANSSCTKVLYAGLYWSGRGASELTFTVEKNGINRQLDKRKVKFKGPGQQDYIDLEVFDDEIRFPESLNTDLGLFVGYKDVTEWVRDWGEGEYTVADIGLTEGTNYHYGGWGMVVVYENLAMKKRDISVFDGYAFVRGQGAASYDIQVSGFSAAKSGDVNLKLGLMAGEGDVGADGDYFAIERGENTNAFEKLSHGNNENNNFFNSSIYTGGNSRSPNLKNNTGMDISVFEIDNQGNSVVANNQTSTTFRYGSTWDVYVIYNITMAIDANDVEVEPLHELISVNGNEVNDVFPEFFPGDELEFMVTIKNKGDIPIDRSKIEIPIPEGLTFLDAFPELYFDESSNGAFNYFSQVGSGGTIVWEMGFLPSPEDKEEILGTFRYRMQVSESCQELMAICDRSFEIDGSVFGENSLTQTSLDPISFIIGYNESVDCLDEPVRGPLLFGLEMDGFLEDHCGWNSTGIPVCVTENDSVRVSDFSSYFPAGTNFYLNLPSGPDDPKLSLSQNIRLQQDELTVYAAHSAQNECYKEFTIFRNDLSLEPVVSISNNCGKGSDNEIGVIVSGGKGPYTYLWDDPESATTPNLSNIEPGEYRVVVTDSLGCVAEASVLLPEGPIFSLEVLEAESNLELGCDQSANGVIVVMVEGDNPPFVLSVEGETNSDGNFSEQLVIAEKGQYEITALQGGVYRLTLSDINGCIASQTAEVKQISEPDLGAIFTYNSSSFNDYGVLYQNSEIQFFSTVNSEENITYYWEFGNGEESTQPNPIIQYGESGEYLVKLVVEDEKGCQVIYEEHLEISGFFIRVPTAFSPNGNNSNDYFFPVFSGLKDIQFWVFNRWGELLFFTDDINSQGWDGKRNGLDMPVGNYLYKLFYINGEEAEYQKTGSFTLVK